MRYFFTLCVLSLSLSLAAQKYQVKGTTVDSAGRVLPGVTLRLLLGKDSVAVVSDSLGRFSFPNIQADSFQFVATYTGLEPFYQYYRRPYELSLIHI